MSECDSGRLVLLVDDNPFVRYALTRALSAEGWSAVAVATAEDAVAALVDDRYALVLSDFNLGDGANGVEVLALARERCPSARRVLMSGAGRDGVGAPARDAAVDVFVDKPIDIATLRALLR